MSQPKIIVHYSNGESVPSNNYLEEILRLGYVWDSVIENAMVITTEVSEDRSEIWVERF